MVKHIQLVSPHHFQENLQKTSHTEEDDDFDVHQAQISLAPLMAFPQSAFETFQKQYKDFTSNFWGKRYDLGTPDQTLFEEYDDGNVLFGATYDLGWWCQDKAPPQISLQFPNVYCGLTYLEEQGIYGQMLYKRGVELFRTKGAIGTLPEHCFENEDGYKSIKWNYSMEWQLGLLKEQLNQFLKQESIS